MPLTAQKLTVRELAWPLSLTKSSSLKPDISVRPPPVRFDPDDVRTGGNQQLSGHYWDKADVDRDHTAAARVATR